MFRICLIFQGASEEFFFRSAAAEVQKRYEGRVELALFDGFTADADKGAYEACRRALEEADFVYLSCHSGLSYFESYHSLSGLFTEKTPFFYHSELEDESAEMAAQSSLSPVIRKELSDYLLAGGLENALGFFLCLLNKVGGLDCEVPPVQWPCWDGLYGLEAGESEDEALLRVAKEREERPVVGVLLSYHYYSRDDTAHVDALMEALRRKGVCPLAVYSNMTPAPGYRGLHGAMDRYLLEDGKSRVDALVVTCGHSLTALAAPGEGMGLHFESVFARLDVPVLQAMTTYFNRQQWQESASGLDSMLLCSNVYQPEFDGQIISVTAACTEYELGPEGAKPVTTPIPDRMEKVASLAANWAKLHRKPMQDKKVALILHNMPPRADMIGYAYGLDTPESLTTILKAMQAEGLQLDYDFADGKEIVEAIMKGLTNDCRFLSPRDMLSRCERTVGKERWQSWFGQLSDKVKAELCRDWGDPPGDFMTVDGQILIPGIHNGNLFIGLQPMRAFEEKAEDAYHSTELVCPWQYLAFYRYLREDFGADVLVHVGTHGTLEWLPGKEVGLSSDCYPELALGDIPHLYLYSIDIPGEGSQAKRRSDAVILDHLIPSMTESGLYGVLAEIDDAIDQYHHVRLNDPAKLESVMDRIWTLSQENKLDQDMNITEEAYRADPETIIERIHLWLSDIKNVKIKNGLHRFGQVPEGKRYDDMLSLLVSLRNGENPSLREGVCALLGQDLEELLDSPQGTGENCKAHQLERVDELGSRAFALLSEGGYTREAALNAVEALCGELENSADPEPLRRCLLYVAEVLKPKLDATGDELRLFLKGLHGDFVPQGPSGAPSRGNAEILPTGRNFFLIDPTAVPSRSAWETGKRLGDDLLRRHKEESGEVPESVAIIVHAGETIKTGGDDIAEILYLYGVRPVWLGGSDRVIGLEAIPMEELGRPRVDVTLRISGLFRDTFPNLIERIEDAVNLVASLDEPEDQNFIKKHISHDLQDFLKDGMSREQAFDYARLRVFGCPAGTYGAGVDTLINTRQWQTSEELGAAFITWSGNAYSRALHGAKLQNVFSKRLAGTEATVKNIPSYEMDMLDNEDFYNYHGGLISAIRKERGELPASYSTSAGDPRHVETRSIHEDASRIMRARIANPKWISGLQEHGYRGAQEMSAMVDIVFGWDATSSVVDDWMYERIAEDYLLNEELRDWLQEVNPWALHAMSERLLEAAQRGMWEADEDMLQQLTEIYLNAEGDMEDL